MASWSITDVYPGKDGIVRVVSVKASNKKEIIQRPLAAICVLPFEEVYNTDEIST